MLSQPENFYPVSLALSGREVIIFGGLCAPLLTHLMEAGASATVVALGFESDILDLQVTYGSRIELVRVSESKYLAGDVDLSRFSLVLSLAASTETSERAAALAHQYRVPFYAPGLPSSFVPVTTFKRGHVKISVSTDGICQPLEVALMQRIEELLVNDFDRYSIFLSAVQEKTSLVEDNYKDFEETAARSAELASALSRNNFEEALKIIEQLQKSHCDASLIASTGDLD